MIKTWVKGLFLLCVACFLSCGGVGSAPQSAPTANAVTPAPIPTVDGRKAFAASLSRPGIPHLDIYTEEWCGDKTYPRLVFQSAAMSSDEQCTLVSDPAFNALAQSYGFSQIIASGGGPFSARANLVTGEIDCP